MSFKLARFFSFIIRFLVGVFFLVIGAFCLILPWSSDLQHETTQFILEHTLILTLVGLGLASIGLFTLIYTLVATRHRVVSIRTGNLAVKVDEKVVHKYMEAYWKEKFPNEQIPIKLKFKKHSIQVTADLPHLPLDAQKEFLENVKYDFSDIFGRLLGYPHDVQFIAKFQKENKLS